MSTLQLSNISNVAASDADPDSQFICHLCGVKFTRGSSLKRHIKAQHQGVAIMSRCHICTKLFPNEKALGIHFTTDHQVKTDFEKRKDALNGSIQWYSKVLNAFITFEELHSRSYIQEIIDFINENLRVK